MTTDQILSTAVLVVLALAGVGLIALLERTHRRTSTPRPRPGERLSDDADRRRLVDELRTRSGSDPRPVPRPAGVTSLAPTPTSSARRGPSRRSAA